MASGEQLEAWAAEAANGLAEKIGPGAQVIVMVADLGTAASPYMIERRGVPIGLVWLLQVGRRLLEELLLPRPTIRRIDE